MALTFAKDTFTEGGPPDLSPATMQKIHDWIDPLAVSAATRAARGVGTLEADSAPSYGIGGAAKNAPDLNAQYEGGLFQFSNTCPGTPEAIAGEAIVIRNGATSATQYAAVVPALNQLRIYVRFLNAGAGTWFQIFNSFSDGNGGQAPAGKGPVAVTASLAQNSYASFTMSLSSAYIVQAIHTNSNDVVSCLVFTTAGGGILFSHIKAGTANIDITSSGMDIRINQKNAAASTINYAVARI